MPIKLAVIAGERFGKLVVIGESLQDSKYFRLACDCGTRFIAAKGSVRSGNTKSCGCARISTLRAQKTTHGLTLHPLYRTWADMRKRVLNKNSKSYANYGGRGITICSRWDDFSKFVEDMGVRPERHTLDRIDNNGDYSPSNCRWAAPATQVENRRVSLRYMYNNVAYTLRELSKISETFGVNYSNLRCRISKGIPVQLAVETPLARVGWHPKPSDGRCLKKRVGVVNLYDSNSVGGV